MGKQLVLWKINTLKSKWSHYEKLLLKGNWKPNHIILIPIKPIPWFICLRFFFWQLVGADEYENCYFQSKRQSDNNENIVVQLLIKSTLRNSIVDHNKILRRHVNSQCRRVPYLKPEVLVPKRITGWLWLEGSPGDCPTPLLRSESCRVDCTGLCHVSFWAYLKIKTPQAIWVPFSNVWPIHQWERIFWCLNQTCCISFCDHFPVSSD